MCECVPWLSLGYVQVVIEIVDMHLSVTETSPRSDMKVADDFVDAESAFDAATLASLFIKFLRIMFSLALFYILATSECPRHGSVGLAHFFAGVAATRFRCFWGSGGTVTIAAIIWVKVAGCFIPMTSSRR